jgi:hypothetical protein
MWISLSALLILITMVEVYGPDMRNEKVERKGV